MARHLAIAVAVDHLDMVVEADDRGRDADLFVELAQGGLLERFAHLDETAGKREQAFGRRPVARGEQDAPVADDRKGRRKQRMLGIGPPRHVTPSEARRRRKKALRSNAGSPFATSDMLAAIDVQLGAVHIGTRIRAQEIDRLCHLVGLPEPMQAGFAR